MEPRNIFSLYVAAFLIVCNVAFAQEKMPYHIFSKKGKMSTYNKMLKAAESHEIVLFGEHHDNSIVHWLELALAKDLANEKRIIMGAEMVETDNQAVLDKYLRKEITQKQLDSSARLWPNHKTDYKPLIDFAQENKIKFIATNVPRRYASMVYKNGFDALTNLTPEEHAMMAPLPIEYDKNLPGYLKMVEEMGGHGGDNLPKAQALKDATMAYNISKNMAKDLVFLHYNGTYHSDNFDGIYWYLKKYQPNAKILTIATVSQRDIKHLEKTNYNKADFIIVIDEDVTKTY